MIIFINDDEEYLHWISVHPTGYVVNARRSPESSYLKLHRASCAHISSPARENWTTNQYIKLCSVQLQELVDWARRDVQGELDLGCRCNADRKIENQDAPALVVVEGLSSSFDGQEWRLWRPKDELIAIESLEPLKASWEASSHPDQQRLQAYRQHIQNALADHLVSDRMYLHLHVAFSDYKKMLSGNDLENYLTPLFEYGCLPANRFRLVMAEKALGNESRLSVGIAEEFCPDRDVMLYNHASLFPAKPPSKDKELKLEIEEALRTSCPMPIADGEVDVQIAVERAIGTGRSWHCLWKSIGDAMGPVVGFYSRKNRFDPKDDRITSLALHFCPDESMGSTMRIGYWWRLQNG